IRVVRSGCRLERDADRVKGTCADVPIDDPDAADRKTPEPGACWRGMAAVRRHFASGSRSAQAIGHVIMNRTSASLLRMCRPPPGAAAGLYTRGTPMS